MEDEPKAPEPLRASTKRGREEADHAGSPPKRARTDAQPTSELRALESAQSPMSGMAYLVVAFVGAKFDFVARPPGKRGGDKRCVANMICVAVSSVLSRIVHPFIGYPVRLLVHIVCPLPQCVAGVGNHGVSATHEILGIAPATALEVDTLSRPGVLEAVNARLPSELRVFGVGLCDNLRRRMVAVHTSCLAPPGLLGAVPIEDVQLTLRALMPGVSDLVMSTVHGWTRIAATCTVAQRKNSPHALRVAVDEYRRAVALSVAVALRLTSLELAQRQLASFAWPFPALGVCVERVDLDGQTHDAALIESETTNFLDLVLAAAYEGRRAFLDWMDKITASLRQAPMRSSVLIKTEEPPEPASQETVMVAQPLSQLAPEPESGSRMSAGVRSTHAREDITAVIGMVTTPSLRPSSIPSAVETRPTPAPVAATAMSLRPTIPPLKSRSAQWQAPSTRSPRSLPSLVIDLGDVSSEVSESDASLCDAEPDASSTAASAAGGDEERLHTVSEQDVNALIAQFRHSGEQDTAEVEARYDEHGRHEELAAATLAARVGALDAALRSVKSAHASVVERRKDTLNRIAALKKLLVNLEGTVPDHEARIASLEAELSRTRAQLTEAKEKVLRAKLLLALQEKRSASKKRETAPERVVQEREAPASRTEEPSTPVQNSAAPKTSLTEPSAPAPTRGEVARTLWRLAHEADPSEATLLTWSEVLHSLPLSLSSKPRRLAPSTTSPVPVPASTATASGPLGGLESYESPLRSLRSYRLSPHFPASLRSRTYSHRIDPQRPLCRFDLRGICNDATCLFQHQRDYLLPDVDVALDLLDYTSAADYSAQARDLDTLRGQVYAIVTGKASAEGELQRLVQHIRPEHAPALPLAPRTHVVPGSARAHVRTRQGARRTVDEARERHMKAALKKLHAEEEASSEGEGEDSEDEAYLILHDASEEDESEAESDDDDSDTSSRYFHAVGTASRPPLSVAEWLHKAATASHFSALAALRVLSHALEEHRGACALWVPYLALHRHHFSPPEHLRLATIAAQYCHAPLIDLCRLRAALGVSLEAGQQCFVQLLPVLPDSALLVACALTLACAEAEAGELEGAQHLLQALLGWREGSTAPAPPLHDQLAPAATLIAQDEHSIAILTFSLLHLLTFHAVPSLSALTKERLCVAWRPQLVATTPGSEVSTIGFATESHLRSVLHHALTLLPSESEQAHVCYYHLVALECVLAAALSAKAADAPARQRCAARARKAAQEALRNDLTQTWRWQLYAMAEHALGDAMVAFALVEAAMAQIKGDERMRIVELQLRLIAATEHASPTSFDLSAALRRCAVMALAVSRLAEWPTPDTDAAALNAVCASLLALLRNHQLTSRSLPVDELPVAAMAPEDDPVAVLSSASPHSLASLVCENSLAESLLLSLLSVCALVQTPRAAVVLDLLTSAPMSAALSIECITSAVDGVWAWLQSSSTSVDHLPQAADFPPLLDDAMSVPGLWWARCTASPAEQMSVLSAMHAPRFTVTGRWAAHVNARLHRSVAGAETFERLVLALRLHSGVVRVHLRSAQSVLKAISDPVSTLWRALFAHLLGSPKQALRVCLHCLHMGHPRHCAVREAVRNLAALLHLDDARLLPEGVGEDVAEREEARDECHGVD